MQLPKSNEFIFSPRYRVRRHVVYWLCYYIIWTLYWTMVGLPFTENLVRMLLWLPVFMLYSYPVAYGAVPLLLLKERYVLFVGFIILWGLLGWQLNVFFRTNVYGPLMALLTSYHDTNPRSPISFLCMTTTAGSMSISSLTKRWAVKQQQWLQSEKEKAIAQLQVLKAQLHPHFLFNTLNNIYSFSLHQRPQTPQMILKLSSLLSYMLYDCKADEVLLEKEVEVMKAYIELEKERYGDKIDISVNIEGDIQGEFIAPLLILPFLENAFKHGTSEQLEIPWLSLDISVKEGRMLCKLVNSKNESVPFRQNGVGIQNVRTRLELLYPGGYDLKLSDEGEFFVVSLLLQLKGHEKLPAQSALLTQKLPSKTHETTVPADR